MILRPLAVAAALLLTAATAAAHDAKPAARAATPGDRTPVVVDTDMGLDDVAALVALANAPTVRLVAITTVGGAARARVGAQNAARLLALLGQPEVPVAAGADPPGAPPPWRKTAESLAGVTLPALGTTPRHDAVELLASVLAAAADGSVVVLALGPLTNLRRLLAAKPALASKIKIIALPGAAGERAWNAAADVAALRAVLGAGVRIAAVPEATGPRLTIEPATRAQLAASPSPGAQILAALWRSARHTTLPLVDAAVAAAVLGPTPSEELLLSVDDQGVLRAGAGTRATLLRPEPGDAARLLLALWLQAPPDQPEATRDGAAPLARVTSFHGHLGPYVVLGYRMGLLARRLTGTDGYFDIEALPTTRGKPPESCFVDGIQLGTGATTGKGNLKPAVQPGPPRAVFVGKNGKRVAIELAAGLYPALGESIKRHGVAATGLWVLSAPTESLFRVVSPR